MKRTTKGGNTAWRELGREQPRTPRVRGVEAERVRQAHLAGAAAGARAGLAAMNRPVQFASKTTPALDQHIPVTPARWRRQPTAKMIEAWEVVALRGSQKAAAGELRITQAGVQSRLRGYMTAMGIEGPMPGLRVADATRAPTQVTAAEPADAGETPHADTGETLAGESAGQLADSQESLSDQFANEQADESANPLPADVPPETQGLFDQLDELLAAERTPALISVPSAPPPGFLERLVLRQADVELTGSSVVPALAGAMTDATYQVQGLHTARRVVELLAEHGLELVLRQVAP